jgi:hypothetical protein
MLRSYCTDSGFYEKLSLALVTQLFFRVFTDMSNLRDGVWLSLEMDDQDEVACDVRWTVMQTHIKMDELYVAHIVNHSSVSSEYVKFLARNSSDGDAAEANARLVSIEAYV